MQQKEFPFTTASSRRIHGSACVWKLWALLLSNLIADRKLQLHYITKRENNLLFPV